jgi:NAD(P)-dependent dehydrogenase (short-subunit alcohol dehydrogenase family)
MGELFDLTGKVAIITGSSRGIGRAIARQLAEHGANVVISSRKKQQCEETAAEINAAVATERAFAFAASISSRPDLDALFAATLQRFGQIDILVCNAASNPYFGPMSGISDDQFRKTLENNVLANHWLVQLARPGMVARGGGSIIIISSIGGLRGSAVLGAYNISKAADMQLARNLAVELGPQGIRVNCIAPGLIRTEFSKALWEDPGTLEKTVSNMPLRRIGTPEDIAGAAVFLASKASAFMTGETIVVDGGSTILGG